MGRGREGTFFIVECCEIDNEFLKGNFYLCISCRPVVGARLLTSAATASWQILDSILAAAEAPRVSESVLTLPLRLFMVCP